MCSSVAHGVGAPRRRLMSKKRCSPACLRVGYADCLEKDWEARFENRPPAKKLNRTAALVAGGYWLLVVAAFLALQGVGFDMIGSGAIPVAALTLPWSILIIMAHPSLPPDPSRPYHDPLVSSLGTFVLFPLICGALNALLLYWVVSVVQRRRIARQ
jgi:hypothetical protein